VVATETRTAVRETLDTMDEARRYNAWLYDRARPLLGRRVLDAGAGTGAFTERLLADGRTVVALEPDPALAATLRERYAADPRLTVVETDAAGVEGEGFDTIMCFNVLEHVADDDAVLRAFRGALKPDGALLLLVPAHPTLYGRTDRALGHERRYRRADLEGRLVDAGFRVDVLRAVNPIGALGWLVSSRLLRRDRIPSASLRVYDRAVPVFRALDSLTLPFGLSLWAVGRAA